MYEVYISNFKTMNNRTLIHSASGDEKIYNTNLQLALNSAGAFNFTIAPDHPSYKNIKPLKTFVHVMSGSDVIFRGKVMSCTETLQLQKTVSCAGMMSLLSETLVKPQTVQGVTIEAFLEDMLSNYNARAKSGCTITLDKAHSERLTMKVNGMLNYENILQAISELVIVKYGGYVTVTMDESGNNKLVYTKNPYPGNLINQEIRVNENVLDMSIENDMYGFYTCAIAVGAEIGKIIWHDDQALNRTTGEVAKNADYKTTGFISLLNSSKITISTKEPTDSVLMVYYKSDQSILSAVSNAKGEFTKPANAAFAKVCVNILSECNVKVDQNDADADQDAESLTVYVKDQSLIDEYGQIYALIKNENIDDIAELRTWATEELATMKDNDSVMQVGALDLHFIDGSQNEIKIGRKVKLVSSVHEFSTQSGTAHEKTLYVAGINMDITRPDSAQYTLGIDKRNKITALG